MPDEGVELLSKLKAEFNEIDSRQVGWSTLFHSIGLESRNPDLTLKESLKPCNQPLNRYLNVSPYDHSRVVLLNSAVDYINANLVRVPIANRRYVLSQGPLEHTCGHFWLMIWQQETRGVIMLNRIVENNVSKCHQYWPEHADETVSYDDVGLKVTLVREQSKDFYIIRTMRVTNVATGDSRDVLQFHYITWPDFQVPSSPAAFLSFLAAVRSSGSFEVNLNHPRLENDVGPAVIHCSAGIGRSGTFCLIDSCLLLVEKKIVKELDICSILLELRTYRMGLIQTADQLRFCFLGIIHGTQKILREEFISEAKETINQPTATTSGSEDEEEEDGEPPTPPVRSDSLTKSTDSKSSCPPTIDEVSSCDGSGDELSSAEKETEVRRRMIRRERDERKRAMEELVSSIKAKQRASEDRRRRYTAIKQLVPKVVAGAVIVAIVSAVSYKYFT
ncbi:unnamed protein product [Notodromas monacha]|uniref:protein-tyrosine-phosphatase n=1 Tax=Notodromas monacha TaxID=399045 RepID=A0A7R9BR60_9CRUS|nr:unnamed protein product [Notodromas monacha]CAG0919097.1 unnamed protein product [Notodromas monacha]